MAARRCTLPAGDQNRGYIPSSQRRQLSQLSQGCRCRWDFLVIQGGNSSGWRLALLATSSYIRPGSMPLPKGSLGMKDCVPGSCVTGMVARPACLDLVIGSTVRRRHRIRSAVRQLSFTVGGEDADAMMAAREAAFVRSAEATDGDALPPDAKRRPRLDSVKTAGFSPQSQRLWSFDRSTELELMEEMILQIVRPCPLSQFPVAASVPDCSSRLLSPPLVSVSPRRSSWG